MAITFKKGQRVIATLPIGRVIVFLCKERINKELNIREWQIDDGSWISEDVLSHRKLATK